MSDDDNATNGGGKAEFDKDLYGGGDRFTGYDASIGVEEGEGGLDERERAVARCAVGVACGAVLLVGCALEMRHAMRHARN